MSCIGMLNCKGTSTLAVLLLDLLYPCIHAKMLYKKKIKNAFATNLRAQRKVTVVLTANTHTLRSGEHTRRRYSECTDSNTAQLDFNTFVHF